MQIIPSLVHKHDGRGEYILLDPPEHHCSVRKAMKSHQSIFLTLQKRQRWGKKPIFFSHCLKILFLSQQGLTVRSQQAWLCSPLGSGRLGRSNFLKRHQETWKDSFFALRVILKAAQSLQPQFRQPVPPKQLWLLRKGQALTSTLRLGSLSLCTRKKNPVNLEFHQAF